MKGQETLKILLPTGQEVELLLNEATPQLTPILELYSKWFEKHYSTLAPEFLEVNEAITDYLKDKYKINPTVKAFAHWFISSRFGYFKSTLLFEFDKVTKKPLSIVKVKISFPNIENSYTPGILEKDLHEFCYWKQGQQEAIHKAVVSRQMQIKATSAAELDRHNISPKDGGSVSGFNYDLPIYRICPCCQKDVLVHDEAALNYIQSYIEQQKRENTLYKENSTLDRYIKYLKDIVEKRLGEIKEAERIFYGNLSGHHSNQLNWNGFVCLAMWRITNRLDNEEINLLEVTNSNNHKKTGNSKTEKIEAPTWKSLFKDPLQADNVLPLLSEYLSSTGQWIEKPKGVKMVALCIDLEEKGYLRNNLTSETKAAAFNSQFGTNFTYKIYQPSKREKAEVYKEYFNNIPTLKQLKGK
jgi:hypothetical protein